jgi:hypothetical protein
MPSYSTRHLPLLYKFLSQETSAQGNNILPFHTFMLPVTVAVRSETWILAGWLLGSWVRIPIKAWMFVRVFLCCVVLCRYRPCDGLITRPRSPAICLNSLRNLLYVRRPGSNRAVEPQKRKYFHAPNQTVHYETFPILQSQNMFIVAYCMSVNARLLLHIPLASSLFFVKFVIRGSI